MRVLTVKCPKCRESIEVDAASGAVLRSCGEVKAKPGEDFLGVRLRELDQEKARRAAIVEQGREREQARKSEFDQLFRKVKEESGKPVEKPLRPIDVD
jgi:hypothetical protein